MTTLYLLYFLLIIFGYFMCLFAAKMVRLSNKNAKLEKQLTGDLTDFEKLELIVKLHSQVDFDKLRPDQIDLYRKKFVYSNNWFTFVEKK